MAGGTAAGSRELVSQRFIAFTLSSIEGFLACFNVKLCAGKPSSILLSSGQDREDGASGYLRLHSTNIRRTKAQLKKNQKTHRLISGRRLRGKSSWNASSTSSPPRRHHKSLPAGNSLLLRRTLITKSLHILRNAKTTKKEKNIATIHFLVSSTHSD